MNKAYTAELRAALAASDTAALVDLNDCAINEVREFCRERGYNASEFFAGEVARITAGRLSLEAYRTCRRTGSPFRASRSVRRSVWIAAKTRRVLRG